MSEAKRIDGLERTVRRLRATIAVVVVAAAAALVSAAGAGPKSIKATRVEIVSPKGDTRVVLDQNVESGELRIYDATGAVVTRLPAKKKADDGR